ncbi:MAG: germination protein YpeB [Clostridia bacterium]
MSTRKKASKQTLGFAIFFGVMWTLTIALSIFYALAGNVYGNTKVEGNQLNSYTLTIKNADPDIAKSKLNNLIRINATLTAPKSDFTVIPDKVIDNKGSANNASLNDNNQNLNKDTKDIKDTTSDKTSGELIPSQQQDEGNLTKNELAKQKLNNLYQQCVYQLTDDMRNVAVSLSKLAVSNDTINAGKLIMQTMGYLSSSSTNISLLPINSSVKVISNANKFINQTQDLLSCLAGHSSLGDKLTQRERQYLSKLQKVAENFYLVLENNAIEGDMTNFDMEGISNSDQAKSLFNYPTLIYDGPYADSFAEKKLVLGEDITSQQGLNYIKRTFADYGIAKLDYVDTITNKAKALRYSMTTNNGAEFTVMLTTDGRLLQFDGYNAPISASKPYNKDKYIKIAENLAKNLGFDCKAMWASKPIDDRIYINLVYTVDGVRVYPDMIKMAIDTTSDQVVGIETFAYLVNHKTRTIPQGHDKFYQASAKLSSGLNVSSKSLAIIPDDCGKEHLCYELVCTQGKDKYYVYIDCQTLRERDILKVINTQQGYYVM